MSLKLFIEQVVAEELSEFSTEILDAQPTTKAKIRYLRQVFAPQKGLEGSFRIVFYIDDKRVIKIDKVDIIENQEEINASACLGSYATQVLDHAADGRWVISQRAEEIETPMEYENALSDLVGEIVTSQTFEPGLVYQVYKTGAFRPWALDRMVKDNPLAIDLSNRLMANNEWFRGLVNVLVKCNVNPSDLRFSNWGLLNGKLVIIDYGGGKL